MLIDKEQEETTQTEPEAEVEAKDDEQEVAKTTDEQETDKTTNEDEATKNSEKPESQPTEFEFKLPKRSNSVAEKAKMFEEKMSSPIIPMHSPRKPKIILPVAEPPNPMMSSQVQEDQLIDLQDPPLSSGPLLESPPPSKSLPTQPVEPPASPHSESPPPPPLEPPPPMPLEPPPPLPLEPPPPLPLESPPPTPPESPPPPPSTEPPLLEVSKMESPPPPTQAADGIQERSSTMPATERKQKVIQRLVEL